MCTCRAWTAWKQPGRYGRWKQKPAPRERLSWRSPPMPSPKIATPAMPRAWTVFWSSRSTATAWRRRLLPVQPRSQRDLSSRRRLAFADRARRHRIASSVLCEAVSEGPILLHHLDQVHEHILRPNDRAFAQELRDPQKQRFLLFEGAGVAHGELDQHQIVAPGDVKISRAVAEVRGV